MMARRRCACGPETWRTGRKPSPASSRRCSSDRRDLNGPVKTSTRRRTPEVRITDLRPLSKFPCCVAIERRAKTRARINGSGRFGTRYHAEPPPAPRRRADGSRPAAAQRLGRRRLEIEDRRATMLVGQRRRVELHELGAHAALSQPPPVKSTFGHPPRRPG
jgi:hypothetical protein